MENINEILSQLALSPAEIELYLLLLDKPRLHIVNIARLTDYHRPRIMEVLHSLEEKRLIEHNLSGKRKVYSAIAPYVLIERAKKTLASVQAALPSLIERQQKSRSINQIQNFTGEEGLRACFMDVVLSLNKNDTFYRISSASDQQYVDSLLPPEYRSIRDAKQLERLVITSRYVGVQKRPRLERSIRYFDETDELFEHNVIQFIYGDKVSLLDFNSLTGTIIKNKAIADFQKNVFLTLYKRLDRDS